MATIARNGISLAYDDRGAGEPIIVFVHGWTCDRSFFAPQAEYFARRHRVVSVDLRGHGESDKPHEPYPIRAYADDIAYLIDQLGLGKVVAVGHSMGGLAVLQLAASYPHSVAAIVMVEPGPFVALPPTFATAWRRLRTPSRQATRNRDGSSSETNCSSRRPIRCLSKMCCVSQWRRQATLLPARCGESSRLMAGRCGPL